MDILREKADQYQGLFNLMSKEHGLILTISEMDEIIIEAQKVVNKNFALADANVTNVGEVAAEEILREYVSFEDVNGSETVELLPLTIIDIIEELQFRQPLVSCSLLERAMQALDDYLNAGCKETRKQAAEKAKVLYKEYYGVDYVNRNDR